MEFGVEGKGNGKGEWLLFSVVDVLEFRGKDIIFPAGESWRSRSLPNTNYCSLYNNDFPKSQQIFFTRKVDRVGQTKPI